MKRLSFAEKAKMEREKNLKKILFVGYKCIFILLIQSICLINA